MRSMSRIFAGVALAVTMFARPALAQDEVRDFPSWYALARTPIGSLPPLSASARLGEPMHLAMRYGRLAIDDDTSLDNGGVTLDFPSGTRGRGSITLAGTFCNGCDPVLGVAFEHEEILSHRTLGVGELTLSARPSVGLGHRTRGRDDFLIGGAIGASAALRVVGSITSYLVPAIGAGTILGDSDAPVRVHPMIGGGVRSTWESLDAVLGIGFQRVVARGSHTVFGATFSIAIEAP